MFLLPGSCETLKVPLTATLSLLGMLAINVVVMTCYAITIILSSLGSLTRPKPREKVVLFICVIIVLFVLEMVWLLFSTYSAISANLNADTAVVMADVMDVGVANESMADGSGEGVASGTDEGECYVVLLYSISVGLAWFSSLLITALTTCSLDPCGCFIPTRYIKHIMNAHKYGGDDETVLQQSLGDYDRLNHVKGHYSNQIGSTLFWARFRQTFCSCVHRDGLSLSKRDALGDVVSVLGLLFGDVDRTFSDLLAGFLLASLYQRNLKAAGKNWEEELTKVSPYPITGSTG
jgi:hypothetical protein